jgi:hypothetical protein
VIGWKLLVALRKVSGVRSLSLPATPRPVDTLRPALTRPTKTSSIWPGSFAFGASESTERAAIGGKPQILLVCGCLVRRTLGSRRPWRS